MTFGLVAIVKDEAATIEACLASLRPHISAWTVVDTGSKDGTRAIIRDRLDGIPGKVYTRRWVNFGVNRSAAFALARGSADWLIATDADMTWEIDPDFEPDPRVEAYMIELHNEGMSYRLPLLLRGDLPWQSFGAVHEYTGFPNRPYSSAPTDKVRVTLGADRSSVAKTAWQAGMLEADMKRNPIDARTVFYLAQTYRELGRTEDALRLYRQRMTMGGFEEERWYASYRAALLETEWSARSAALMASWEARPWRLEPLYELAKECNARGWHHLGYLLTEVPTEPTLDQLFVHSSVWDWGIMFERSIAAWWVAGSRDEFESLSATLLANPSLPEVIREAVEHNLGLEARVA